MCRLAHRAKIGDLGNHRADAIVEGGLARADLRPGDEELNIEQPMLVYDIRCDHQEISDGNRERNGCIYPLDSEMQEGKHSDHD